VATKHKDHETVSSSIYNQARLGSPIVRLEEFIGSENIRNQDVVVWVSGGLYHIPTSEDAPVTTTTSNNIGFSLIPFNYGDESLATDMADMVLLTKATDKAPIVNDATRCAATYQQIPYLTDGFEG
jgi:diamine oxidase